MEAEEGVPTEPVAEDYSAVQAVSAASDQAATEGEASNSTDGGVPQQEAPSAPEHDGDDVASGLNDGADECAVCLCLLCEPVELGCGHTFWYVSCHLQIVLDAHV